MYKVSVDGALEPNRGQGNVVERSGSVVGLVPLVRRVAGSNPALAAKYGPWASLSLAIACGASAWSFDTVSVMKSGGPLRSSGLEEAL